MFGTFGGWFPEFFASLFVCYTLTPEQKAVLMQVAGIESNISLCSSLFVCYFNVNA